MIAGASLRVGALQRRYQLTDFAMTMHRHGSESTLTNDHGRYVNNVVYCWVRILRSAQRAVILHCPHGVYMSPW
jgi:hypothetical protein